jgi:hypothetical protein
MSIYNIPYTYLIVWSSTGMKYYGVRYAKDCNPADLWKTYFTSSRYVAEYRKTHGDPDIIMIRKTFLGEDAVDKARLWENRVLKRMGVVSRPDYLNEGDNRAISPAASSRARKGVSPGNKGKPQPEHIKNKKRKPKPKVTCPHCGTEGGISSMHRHHFANCGKGITTETSKKLKTINTTKAKRQIVSALKQLKEEVPKNIQKKLDESAGIKSGWYQLTDNRIQQAITIYENYLS